MPTNLTLEYIKANDEKARRLVQAYVKKHDRKLLDDAAECWSRSVQASDALTTNTNHKILLAQYAVSCADSLRLTAGSVCKPAQSLYILALEMLSDLARAEAELGQNGGEGNVAFANALDYLSCVYGEEDRFETYATRMAKMAAAIRAQSSPVICDEPLAGTAPRFLDIFQSK